MTQSAPKKTMSPENEQAFCARLNAVQAIYQMIFNKRPIKEVAKDYKERENVDSEGESLAKPDFIHFKTVLFGVDERMLELESIIQAHLQKDEQGPQRVVEPLLNAIFLCGTYELLACQDIDSALIINDYLNVTHGFYEQSEVSFVNAVLDAISKLLREV